MKKTLLIALTIALLAGFLARPLAAQDEKIRLGVLRFTNHTAAGWWRGSVGTELQDMLAAELVSTDAFSVLERKEIDAVLGEQDLGDSGRVSPATKAKLGRLKGAQYLIAGTVSAYEEDVSGQKAGVSFKGLSLGGAKNKAYIAVDMKVIDAETGEIVDARTIEANAKGSALGAGLSLRNFSIGGEDYKNTPTGKVIRACILYIAEYLECSLVEGKDASCMKKWNKMESKRKEKTKDAIDLDD